MKSLKLKRLKPSQLPPNPDIIDKVEHAFQCLLSWFVIDIENHPTISGMLTGFMLSVPFWCITFLAHWLLLHGTGHWKP